MLNSCCFVRVLLHAHGSHCAAHRVVPFGQSGAGGAIVAIVVLLILVAMMLPQVFA